MLCINHECVVLGMFTVFKSLSRRRQFTKYIVSAVVHQTEVCVVCGEASFYIWKKVRIGILILIFDPLLVIFRERIFGVELNGNILRMYGTQSKRERLIQISQRKLKQKQIESQESAVCNRID